MSDEDALEQLASEGAKTLILDPTKAAESFVAAHEIAVRIGDAKHAAALSSLLARAWGMMGSRSRPLSFCRRATREDADSPDAFYTFGHFCDAAANRAERDRKRRRAIVLFLAAERAYTQGANAKGESRLTDLMQLAGRSGAEARRLIAEAGG